MSIFIEVYYSTNKKGRWGTPLFYESKLDIDKIFNGICPNGVDHKIESNLF